MKSDEPRRADGVDLYVDFLYRYAIVTVKTPSWIDVPRRFPTNQRTQMPRVFHPPPEPQARGSRWVKF